MRYVVIGAGAVGGAIGGLLAAAGCDVLLCARGQQLAALSEKGLELGLPSRTLHPTLEVRGQVDWRADDVALLCTKTQHAAAALTMVPADVPVVCAQNGVAAERLACASLARVYGMMVFSPLGFLEPGRVTVHSEPIHGAIDVGVWPEGMDALVETLVTDLRRAGFEARADGRIRATKYGKLLLSVGNAVEALAGRDALKRAWRALEEEALACFAAAGIEHLPAAAIFERSAGVTDLPVNGARRPGGSTWQSLQRRTGDAETDWLNGEIVRLGAEHGIPTPRNRALVELMARATAEGWHPGALPVEELESALARSCGGPPALRH
jgi:2-dehydropantoate 2-reductase